MKQTFYLIFLLASIFYSKTSSAQIITSFSPASGTSGTLVTIKGSQFFGGNGNSVGVNFGTYGAASILSISDTQIVAQVGPGATGRIQVYKVVGVTPFSTYSTDTFQYVPPVITDTSWTSVGQAGFSAAKVDVVRMAMDTTSIPYVTYADKLNSNKIAVKKLGANNNWESVGDIVSQGAGSYSNIAVGSDGVPYVAYIDSANGNKISVEKYTNGLWQYVGNPGFDIVVNFSTAVAIAVDSKNVPYVVSTSGSFPSYKIDVLKFNGSEWQSLGNLGLSSYFGEASISIDKKTDNVYLFSTDNSDPFNNPVVVKKFNNQTWTVVGSEGFYSYRGSVRDLSIVVDSSGLPVVSMQSNSLISVYHFDGNSWLTAGNTNFPTENARNVSLAIDSNNNLFVLFVNNLYNNLGSVMTLKSENAYNNVWQYLGAKGFAASSYISSNAIAVSKYGVPYIVFADTTNEQKATVKRYENYVEFTPRTLDNLLFVIDSCLPWKKEYPDWNTLYDDENANGRSIEMQTQFQDNPGNLCGYESYIDSAPVYRSDLILSSENVFLPRRYRVSFSNSPFTHQVGVRLFATTAELNQTLAMASQINGVSPSQEDIFVYGYDGPNEDTSLDNNVAGTKGATDTSFINYYTRYFPTVHYYGANNEYCYFEFYTNHFSEFHIGVLTFGLLPVNLISFSATAQNHIANLTWQTTSEVNTSYFTVQRSVDGIHFTNVGKVNAANTAGNHSYTYQDDLSLLNNVPAVYYRLQTTDKDGSTSTSKTVSISLVNNKLISIQPNPAHNVITVTSSIAGQVSITITDMNGKEIFIRNNVINTQKIDISSLAKGIYVVRFSYASGHTVQKLLVE